MKKLLFSAALALVAIGFNASAQDEVNNKVVNGDFEDPNYVQSVPSDWTWEPWNTQNVLTELPGWSLETGGIWNGGVEIKRGEEYIGDGEIRPEEDMAFAHLFGYDNNGWTSVSMYQVVENLKPGLEYNLSYLVAVSWPDGEAWTPDPDFGYEVAEVSTDADGKVVAGRGIISANLGSKLNDEIFTDFDLPMTAKFTAPADGKVYLRIYLRNTYGEGNKHGGLWMDVDMVKIWSPEDTEGAGVNVIEVSDANAPVEYYNLQGVRVANPQNGIFIRKEGNKALKVVL